MLFCEARPNSRSTLGSADRQRGLALILNLSQLVTQARRFRAILVSQNVILHRANASHRFKDFADAVVRRDDSWNRVVLVKKTVHAPLPCRPMRYLVADRNMTRLVTEYGKMPSGLLLRLPSNLSNAASARCHSTALLFSP